MSDWQFPFVYPDVISGLNISQKTW